MSEQTEPIYIENEMNGESIKQDEGTDSGKKKRGRPRKPKQEPEQEQKRRRPNLQIPENAQGHISTTIMIDVHIYRRVLTFLNQYNFKIAVPQNKKKKSIKDVLNSALLVYLNQWEESVLNYPVQEEDKKNNPSHTEEEE
jgi:hypothetical protein